MTFKKSASLLGITLFFAFITFNACKKENNNLPETKRTFTVVNGFAINKTGEKILATDSGMFVLNVSTGELEFVENKNDLKPINDLTFTRNSNELWLASNSGVLDFDNQDLINSSNSGLHNNSVSQLDFDFSNRGIFAIPNGLSINNNGKWLKSTGQDDLYLNYRITDVASTENGYTYVATKGGGIERIEMDVDGISGATIFETDWTFLESNNINTIFIDSITQVYGTELGVAFHYSEFTKWDWEVFDGSHGLIDDNVISVVKDKDNNWWFGTTKGLSRLNNSEWTSFTKETHNFISDTIKFLAVDTDGSVWFASDKGLSRFVNNQWTNYSK